MSREFYMGDNFNRSLGEIEEIGNWDTMCCCNSTGAMPNSYAVADGVSSHVETKFEGLENSIKALSKQMENIKFSAKDVGAALKGLSDKLSGGRRSLRSELKTLGGNGRYV